MALIYPQNGDLTKLLKSARKKVPQSARLSAGGGVQKLKGQCPNAPRVNLRKASLTLSAVDPGNPNLFSSTHRGVRLVDRKNPQPMDIATVAEVS